MANQNTATAIKIKLPDVRLSHPKIFKPEGFQGSSENPKYSASAHLDPGIPSHKKALKQIKAEMDKLGLAKWPDKWVKGKGMKGIKGYCLKSYDEDVGDEEPMVSLITPDSGEVPDGMEGLYVLSASEKTRPTVVNRDKSPLTEEDAVIYAGCYVTMIVSMWAQDNKFGKRMNANLIGIQFKKDGDPFGDGAQKATDDDFDDWEEDDDDLMG